MPKLTVLIFSKDDNRQALGLIRDVYAIADEIVLMDGSGAKDRMFIANEKARLKLAKLKIHNVVALGYREPLMMYAFRKCSNNWVMYLDTDERPSECLKRDVAKLISDNRYNAYAIGVYSVRGKNDENLVSWQFMLFKKSMIEFKGMLHERATVHGRYATLTGKEYRINQMVNGMVHSAMGRYAEMERFQRYTYAQHNIRVLENIGKVGIPERGGVMTPGKGLALALLKAYEAIGMKKQGDEISNFDYWAFWLARNVAHQTRRGSAVGIAQVVRESFEYARRMREWRSGPYGKDDLGIARLLEQHGVTKFLNLDDEKTVDALTKRYIDREQGIGLLVRLIRERYADYKKQRGI